MADARAQRGPLLSALGAGLLALAVFLPWYGIAFTSAGVAEAQDALNGVAARYGNPAFQSLAGTVGSRFQALASRHLASVSGHAILTHTSVLLLVLAGLALLGAVARLAGAPLDTQRVNRATAVCGLVCAVAVAYRMVDPPAGGQGLLSLTLEVGVWLALLGSIGMVAGAFWPQASSVSTGQDAASSRVWEQLSGWTPQ